MTVREYLTTKFAPFGIVLSEADFAEISFQVDINEELTDENMKDALRAVALSIIPQFLLRAKNVSENGFSISWDADALLRWYEWLCSYLEIDNQLTTFVRDVTDRW